MNVGLLSGNRFLQRIVATVLEEDDHTIFFSRYWTVFENRIRKEDFQIILYECPGTCCPFSKRRCVLLTKSLQIPSIIITSEKANWGASLYFDQMFFFISNPFYPQDLLDLFRKISEKYETDSSKTKDNMEQRSANTNPLVFENIVELAPNILFDRSTKSIINKSLRIQLSPREDRLLEELIRNEGKVIGYDSLFYYIWGDNDKVSFDNLYVLVRSLKKKLGWDQGNMKNSIKNIYGSGYILQLPEIQEEECSSGN